MPQDRPKLSDFTPDAPAPPSQADQGKDQAAATGKAKLTEFAPLAAGAQRIEPAGAKHKPSVLQTGRPTISKAADYLPTVGGVAGGLVGHGMWSIPLSGVGGATGEALARWIHRVSGDPVAMSRDEESGFLQGVAKAGAEQMIFDAGGRLIGAVVKGGFLRPAPGTSDEAVRETVKKFKLKGVSASEQVMGTRAGRMVRPIQSLATRSIGGRMITEGAREAGDKQVIEILEKNLDAIAGVRPSPASAGRSVQAGLKLAKKGEEQVGKEMAAAAAAAPAPGIGAIQQEARAIFEKEIFPKFVEMPTLAPKTPAWQQVMALAPNLRPHIMKDPGMRQLLMDEALASEKTPLLKTLNTIVHANEQMPFKQAAELRTILREAGKAPDELLGDKAKGLASHFEGRLTRLLFDASPDFAAASQQYGEGARLLKSRFVRNIMKSDPEAIVTALKRKTPTRVATLRDLLLNYTGKIAPGATAAERATAQAQATQGRLTWNRIRTTWFNETILKDANTNLPDPYGMLRRLGKTDPQVLTEFFGKDVEGRALLQNARDLAEALGRRQKLPSGRMFEILEATKLVGAAAAGKYFGAQGAVGGLTILEGVPALITWALHNKQATSYLIEGLTTYDVPRAASLITKIGAMYRTSQSQQPNAAASEENRPRPQ